MTKDDNQEEGPQSVDRIQAAMERYRSSPIPERSFVLTGSSGFPSVVEPRSDVVSETVEPFSCKGEKSRFLPYLLDQSISDTYKILRTQVLQRLQSRGWNVLGVTSSFPKEGKTQVAVNLAMSIANEKNHTVLLIDGNLRNPSVTKFLGIPDRKGLSEYLQGGGIPLESLLITPNYPGFLLMPGGESVHDPVDLFGTPKMGAFLEETKHRYHDRVILIDLPPVLDKADVLVVGPHLDAVIMVVEENRTDQQRLRESLLSLNGVVPVLGTVLNKAYKAV